MRKNLFLILITAVIFGGGGYLVGMGQLRFSFANYKPAVVLNKQSTKYQDVDFAQFWAVWDKLNEQYVDKSVLDPKKMVDGAISGMVSALGDPYTVFLPKTQNDEVKADLDGAFEGVGIQLGFKEKILAVVSALDSTPAKRAGVKSGDLIIHIKDVAKNIDRDTNGITLPEAVSIIRGKKGSEVELTLVRESESKPIIVKLVRDTIVVKSATVDLPAGRQDLAILKLNRFGDRTQEEWLDAVEKIANRKPQITGIVLDLRNNPGGYLEGSVYIASEFLPMGKVVVTQQYGDGSKVEHKVTRVGKLLKIPMVVLVNEGSASAAEILAGALQDYKRAKIVGMKSFGKGSVQQPEDFSDGSGIHITVAKWLRPSGDWIDKIGIMPDVEVKVDETATDSTNDTQLEKAMETIRG
ncbi:MAG: Carboxyl-terminal protease [Candidatus Amesbacteria bacterium GW2011_GWA2_42_12]|uniref:Carboxyl-terminal protease n=1 Tax=Candidatus Amesbacteria bacterium GW2011_GWA2_42_12 TaxID=1618356 RepID=A0A0G1AGA2_9BACT|nr:MAG: Carboxyl-terminal protease [Candidatus Amesbacteria bacterium GW2011_GWA2_42_12]